MVLFEEKRGEDWLRKLAIYRMKRKQDGWVKHAMVTLPGDVARALGEELAKHAFDDGEEEEP